MQKSYLFTSESVSEGHPDKVCDGISDALLDLFLCADPQARAAVETIATTDRVILCGEFRLPETFDKSRIEQTVREKVREIGYEGAGFDWRTLTLENYMHAQSADIAMGVDATETKEEGAGDQGIIFGYASNELAGQELMPAPVALSHKILKELARMRHSGEVGWLRPDAKSQVTIEYEGHKPLRIDTVVISHQHAPDIAYADIKEALISQIIKPVLEPTGLIDSKTRFFINPTGRFVVGGPFGDTGLTGRKIIVDTYGGMGRHGGGAFSGKDPSKVDRSAAYMARYIAKNVVAAGLAERCEVQLAYAIGVPFPVSIMVDTFGTGVVPDSEIAKAVEQVFDCSPAAIVRTLDLKRPIYAPTAAYGHFGRSEFSWEKTDRIEELKKAVKG